MSRVGNNETRLIEGNEVSYSENYLDRRGLDVDCEGEDDNETSFFGTYFRTKGAPLILVMTLLLSLGTGSFVSIVPGIMGDRLARINHGCVNLVVVVILLNPADGTSSRFQY